MAPKLLACCAAPGKPEKKFAWQADKLALKVRKVLTEIVQTLKPEELRRWTKNAAGKVLLCHTKYPCHRTAVPLLQYGSPATGRVGPSVRPLQFVRLGRAAHS